jgi:HSP20 family molecular chaperone IbpA
VLIAEGSDPDEWLLPLSIQYRLPTRTQAERIAHRETKEKLEKTRKELEETKEALKVQINAGFMQRLQRWSAGFMQRLQGSAKDSIAQQASKDKRKADFEDLPEGQKKRPKKDEKVEIVPSGEPDPTKKRPLEEAEERAGWKRRALADKRADEMAEALALQNYEKFHQLPAGTATLEQVQNSSAGIYGWAEGKDHGVHGVELVENLNRRLYKLRATTLVLTFSILVFLFYPGSSQGLATQEIRSQGYHAAVHFNTTSDMLSSGLTCQVADASSFGPTTDYEARVVGVIGNRDNTNALLRNVWLIALPQKACAERGLCVLHDADTHSLIVSAGEAPEEAPSSCTGGDDGACDAQIKVDDLDYFAANIIRRMADVVVFTVDAFDFLEQRQLVEFRLARPDVGVIIAHNIASEGNESEVKGSFMEQFGSSHVESMVYRKLLYHSCSTSATHIGFSSEDVAAVNTESRKTFMNYLLDTPKKQVSFMHRLGQAFVETIAPFVVSADSRPITVEINKNTATLSCAPNCKLKEEVRRDQALPDADIYEEGEGDDRRRVFELEIPGRKKEHVNVAMVDGRYLLEISLGAPEGAGQAGTSNLWRRVLPFDDSWDLSHEGIQVEDGVLSLKATRRTKA